MKCFLKKKLGLLRNPVLSSYDSLVLRNFTRVYGNKNWYKFLKGNMLHIVSIKMFMPFELVKPLPRIYYKEITFKREKKLYKKMILTMLHIIT